MNPTFQLHVMSTTQTAIPRVMHRDLSKSAIDPEPLNPKLFNPVHLNLLATDPGIVLARIVC